MQVGVNTAGNVFKKSIVYGYAITQPFALFTNAQLPFQEQLVIDTENLSYGTHSELVRHTQLKLHLLGHYTDRIDGLYGLFTEQAVKSFQSSENLTVDGQMNVETMKSLMNAEKKHAFDSIKTELEAISYGENSEQVTIVQEVLYYYGYYTGNIDGIYGPLTEQAIIEVKKENIVQINGEINQIQSENLLSDTVTELNEQIITKDAKEEKEVAEITSIQIKRIDGEIIQLAKSFIGTPYVWGGTNPSGFDCSGFIQYVYRQVQQSIPRTVNEIWNFSTPVSSPAVGDLVFFETYQPGPSHLGIYLGDGNFIHSGSSRGVEISNLNTVNYWKTRYLGAKRIS